MIRMIQMWKYGRHAFKLLMTTAMLIGLGGIYAASPAPVVEAGPQAALPAGTLWSAGQETGDLSEWSLNGGGRIFNTGTGVASVTSSLAHNGRNAAAIEAASTPATTSIPESAPTVAPTTQAASSPSGQAMPVGNLTGWRQIFADDFSTNAPVGSFPGAAYSSKWSAYPDGWPDTTHNGTYMPSKVLSVRNGMLDYYIHTENGVHMVAAPVPQIAQRTYGRYELRFRADSLRGYKNAWLLWPDSELWPADGEIDFPEGDLDRNISAYMHYADPSGGQDAFEPGTAFGGSWHTAATEWTAGKVTFYLDGKLLGTSTTKVPSKPMHWVLQSETTLNGTHPNDATAGHIQIDWVVAYAPE